MTVKPWFQHRGSIDNPVYKCKAVVWALKRGRTYSDNGHCSISCYSGVRDWLGIHGSEGVTKHRIKVLWEHQHKKKLTLLKTQHGRYRKFPVPDVWICMVIGKAGQTMLHQSTTEVLTNLSVKFSILICKALTSIQPKFDLVYLDSFQFLLPSRVQCSRQKSFWVRHTERH